MADFNELVAVSFSELERTLFEGLTKLFLEAMTELLSRLDAQVAGKRDKQRYVIVERKETCLETMLGPLRFRRRVYLDRETGERVYGLDEALGLTKRARVSPGLKEAAVREAVEAPSYRAARDSLERRHGQRVMSHETIRQLTLKTGKEIQRADEALALEPNGERKIPVLFIKADGLYVSRQKAGKREERFVIAHEGWQRRSPGSEEYELVNKTYIHCDSAGDVWEQASRMLFARYDLSDTVVVVNGDRAKWIREGVRYFPKAIYQFDRFHLLRDVKAKLRLAPQARKEVLQAIRDGRSRDVLDLMHKVRLSDGKLNASSTN
ncbi:MAG: ISLre2 family transposase [Chloroflexota bacterium]